MIETFFGAEQLDTPRAMFAALLVGLAFGFVLERAGFGSSRKLAGIFYFRDMTVLKVMFTAVVTAMLGLSYAFALGWIAPEQVYALPTVYQAQIVGGLLFGVGFVISGWCPGTGAVGAASGKWDAVVFLLGTALGAIGFNELFGVLQTIGLVPSAHESGVVGEPAEPLIAFGVPRALFALLFTLVAIASFHLCGMGRTAHDGWRQVPGQPVAEGSESRPGHFCRRTVHSARARHRPARPHGGRHGSVGSAAEHRDGRRTISNPRNWPTVCCPARRKSCVVDVRTPAEYAAFHIRGAINVALPDLPATLEPYKNRGVIVLYSNGMTHPAQARDVLAQLGFANAYLLTDGLQGFVERCLKPVSLRSEPLSPDDAARVRAWRAFFLAERTSPRRTWCRHPRPPPCRERPMAWPLW